MSITIGDTLLNYKNNENKYIITYIDIKEDYDPYLDTYLNNIFNNIYPHYYTTRALLYSNVCGSNAEYICKNLKMDGIMLGKIIITVWVTKNDEIIKNIEFVYGPIGFTIGASYHALAYLIVFIKETQRQYYVAIETTSYNKYKLQFYVGKNENELKTIIMSRYQCSDVKISFDCEKNWIDIAYNGGKNKKR